MTRSFRKRCAGVILLAGVASLMGCADGEVAECEQVLEQAAQSVEGVDSAEFVCKRDFGNSLEHGSVELSVDAQEKATPIVEGVYRAFAAEGRIGDAWRPYITFVSANNGEEFNDDALDFNGAPVVRDIRDKYDVQPSVSR